MTGREIGRSLRFRLQSGALWGVFAFVFLAYAGYMAWQWPHRVPPIPAGILMSQVVAGFLFYFSFIWLSPLPWLWDGRPGIPEPTVRTVVQAFLWGEASALGLVYIDAATRRHFGAAGSFATSYVFQACFQGPALFLVGYLMAKKERSEVEKAQMRLRAVEAQERHLRSQLHPHVLFNALNGLAELVHEDADQAERHIRSMAALLRRILHAGEVGISPLAEERTLVENYLELEAIRLGGRLRVTWDWPADMDAVPAPPLLLQPLVENAVKHGVAPVRGGGELDIAVGWEGDRLRFRVRNTGRPLPPDSQAGSGIGLRNLAQRLELAYQGQALLHLRQDGPWTVAEIHLDPRRLDPDYAQAPNHRGG